MRKSMMMAMALLGAASLTLHPSWAKTPVELGKVKWIRDIDEGVAQAKKTKKPILVLFQEVPG